MKRNQKWKIPNTVPESGTLRFSSCKNRKLKIKLRYVRAHERIKRAFARLILTKGNFLKICLLSRYIVY